jgi:hypothetical protein
MLPAAEEALAAETLSDYRASSQLSVGTILFCYAGMTDCKVESLSNSPWTRGAPHRGFSMLIRRITPRSSARSAAALPVGATSNAIATKADPMPTHERLRADDCQSLQNGNQRYIRMKSQRSLFVSRTCACSLRLKIFNRCRSTAFSASSRRCLLRSGRDRGVLVTRPPPSTSSLSRPPSSH